jgi:hypothetical protein
MQLLLVIILITIFSFSQRVLPLNLPKYDLVKLHFGMALGINQMSATVYPADDFFELDSIFSAECNPQMGFNINIVSNFNINKYFSIRFLPGLSFGQRNMEYILYNGQKYEQKVMEIPSTYLDFPILFQLKSARLNNFRAYLIGGFSYKQDLAAQKKIADEDKPKIRFKRSTYTYQIGVGADFFLEYFKFAIETKADFGINNILVPDNSEFSSSIKAIKPRVFSVTLLFEGSDSEGLNFMKWFKK